VSLINLQIGSYINFKNRLNKHDLSVDQPNQRPGFTSNVPFGVEQVDTLVTNMKEVTVEILKEKKSQDCYSKSTVNR